MQLPSKGQADERWRGLRSAELNGSEHPVAGEGDGRATGIRPTLFAPPFASFKIPMICSAHLRDQFKYEKHGFGRS
jgi:hypothetical protein